MAYGIFTVLEVAEVSGNALRWFQLYLFKDRTLSEDLVQRAAASGYKALCVTIDSPVLGKRREDARQGIDMPRHLNFGNISTKHLQSGIAKMWEEGNSAFYSNVPIMSSSVTWNDIKWLQSITHLPVVVKGLLTAEDAKIATSHGVAGILVSNHGARQLDGVPATVSYVHLFLVMCMSCDPIA